MKLNKSQLKSIIKECLVEIFQENFSNSKKIGVQNLNQNKISKPNYLAPNIVEQKKPQKNVQEVSKKQQNTNKETSQSQLNIMKEILEDTAKTTFKNMSRADYEFAKANIVEEQITNNHREDNMIENIVKTKSGKNKPTPVIMQGNTAEEIVQNNDPINLFGAETSNKWLKLAFVDKQNDEK